MSSEEEVSTPEVSPPPCVYDDGGRKAAGYKGTAGDCFCRALAIVTERPYQEVYEIINREAVKERSSSRKQGRSSARGGVRAGTARRVARLLGLRWVPMMRIGTGCKVHVREGEIPQKGRQVLNLSRHFTAAVDGVIHDTHDPSRDGYRCVYGWWEA